MIAPAPPPTNARAGPAAVLFGLLAFLPAGSVGLAQDAAAGERLFREGVGADGVPVEAVVHGDVRLRGALAACGKCHRRSGFGSDEGAKIVPPITAAALFAERAPRRLDAFRSLYQEDQPAETRARTLAAAVRPAYDAATLRRALAEGIDASGRPLDPLMPRFDLPEPDRANLLAYLRTLAAAPAPGVDEETIRFAIVIDARVEPPRQRSTLEVLEMFAHCHNLEVDRYRARPELSPHYRALFVPTLRKWELDVWKVYGPAAEWGKELQRRYDERPVFALLGGLTDDRWGAAQAFCERNELPCLFPQTPAPEEAVVPNRYTLYLHGGLPREARELATLVRKDLSRRARRARAGGGVEPTHHVAQIYRRTPAGLAAAEALRAALHGVTVTDVPVHPLGELTAEHAAALRNAGATVAAVWLDEADAARLGELLAEPEPDREPAVWFYSGRLLGRRSVGFAPPPRAFVLWPYSEEEAAVPRSFRVRRWLNSRGVARPEYGREQLHAYFACDVVRHAVRHLTDHHSRDLLIEWVEHETENGLNPGVHPSLSLGPDQRFASRAVAVLPLTGPAHGRSPDRPTSPSEATP